MEEQEEQLLLSHGLPLTVEVAMFTACELCELYRQLVCVCTSFIIRTVIRALTPIAMFLLCAGDGSVLAQRGRPGRILLARREQ